MRKREIWMTLSLLVVLALLVAACGPGEEATPEPTEAAAEPTEAMAEPTEAMAEPTEVMEEEPTEEAMAEGEVMSVEEALAEFPADIGGTVSVLAVWSGEEEESFRAMLQPLLDHTGIELDYTATRDINAVLTTQVEGGNPPDIAGLPGPGQMRQFAQAGNLVALNEILDMEQQRRPSLQMRSARSSDRLPKSRGFDQTLNARLWIRTGIAREVRSISAISRKGSTKAWSMRIPCAITSITTGSLSMTLSRSPSSNTVGEEDPGSGGAILTCPGPTQIYGTT